MMLLIFIGNDVFSLDLNDASQSEVSIPNAQELHSGYINILHASSKQSPISSL